MTLEEAGKKAYDAIVELDDELAYEVLDQAIEEKTDLTQLLIGGYSAGMQQLGELFSCGEVFLPDLMYAAEIMQTVSARIEEELLSIGEAPEKKGKMIMASVHGDVHDIGKSIICSLLKTSGIEVFDLGRDVPAETIVEEAMKNNVDVIGMSALLTTTMIEQRRVIELLKGKDVRDQFIVMVGGAPVTRHWAEKIGADAYSEDASECVRVATELIMKKAGKPA